MSQALRKDNQFSTSSPASRSGHMAEDPGASLDEFFGGWLNSIAPRISKKQPAPAPAFRQRKLPISTTDIVRVNRATVRESTAHRQWPPDVVAQFLAAEVITRKSKRSD